MSRQRPAEFSITSAKRLLQQYRPQADLPARNVRFGDSGIFGRAFGARV
jgi:hypothetical protein